MAKGGKPPYRPRVRSASKEARRRLLSYRAQSQAGILNTGGGRIQREVMWEMNQRDYPPGEPRTVADMGEEEIRALELRYGAPVRRACCGGIGRHASSCDRWTP
jgi:hypothetical protein